MFFDCISNSRILLLLLQAIYTDAILACMLLRLSNYILQPYKACDYCKSEKIVYVKKKFSFFVINKVSGYVS